MRGALRITAWAGTLGVVALIAAAYWVPIEEKLLFARCLKGAKADQLVVHHDRLYYAVLEPVERDFFSRPAIQQEVTWRIVLQTMSGSRSPCQALWRARKNGDESMERELVSGVRVAKDAVPLVYVHEGAVHVGWEDPDGQWKSTVAQGSSPPSFMTWWQGRAYPLGCDRRGVNVVWQVVWAARHSLKVLPWCLVPLGLAWLWAVVLSWIKRSPLHVAASSPLDLLIALPSLAVLLVVANNLDDSRDFLALLSLAAGFLFAPRSAVRLEGQLRRFRESGRYLGDRALGEKLSTTYRLYLRGEGGRSLGVELTSLLAMVLLTQANLSFLRVEEGPLPTQLSLGQLARLGWSSRVTGSVEAGIYLWAPSLIVALLVLGLELLRKRIAREEP